jgi:hypothetical protein
MEDANGADDQNAIHMSLQGKGGVGKSLAASSGSVRTWCSGDNDCTFL